MGAHVAAATSDTCSSSAAIGPLIAALTEPTGPDVLIDRAAGALATLGAIGGALILVNEMGEPTSMSTAGVSATVARRLGAAVVDGGFPAMAALRDGTALWLGTREHVARRFPVFSSISVDWQAYAAMPLRCGARVVGSVAFPFERPQAFDDISRLTIEAVAGVLAAAVHSACMPSHGVDSRPAHSFLLDRLVDGALIVDHDADRIVYANAVALEMFGLTSVDDVDMPIRDVAAWLGISYQRPPLPSIHGSSTSILSVRSANGAERRLRAHASTVDEHRRQLVVLMDLGPEECDVDVRHASETHEALLEDRKRVARDLHDGAIQTVFATSLTLAALALDSPGPIRERIEEAIDGLDHVVTQLRSTVFDLRRRSAGGPTERISALVDGFSSALGLVPSLTVIGEFDALADEGHLVDHLELALRETLSNVARHSHATAVTIALRATDDVVAFSVHDNGIGFSAAAAGGDGLANLRSRAASLGGDCRCESVPGVGTVVHWMVRHTAMRTPPASDSLAS